MTSNLTNLRTSTTLASLAAATLLVIAVCDDAAAGTVEIPLPLSMPSSTNIDNVYWPLAAGDSFAYIAESEDGCEYNKVTVTWATHVVDVDGQLYTTRVLRDQEWEDEECDLIDVALVEDTHDFVAQDDDENIWYFGEDTWAAHDEEECDSAGSWQAGTNEAVPGIVMLGSPKSGNRYQQEFLADQAEDWGAVLRLNAAVSIDFGEFEDCLAIREWTPLEPGQIEHKYYCPMQDGLAPGGLTYIEELKEKTLHVEYVGSVFPFGALPGEGDAFPSSALDCDLP